MLRQEILKLSNRTEYKIISAIFVMAVLIDIWVICYNNYGAGLTEVNSAYCMTVLFNESKAPFRLVFGIFLPICAAYIASDTYLNDSKSGMNSVILTRTDKKSYVRTKAYAIFLLVGCTIFSVLLLDLILALAAFPAHGRVFEQLPWMLVDFGNAPWILGEEHLSIDTKSILGYELYAFHPYLWCMIWIIIRSLTGAIMALFAYAMSFVIKNRYIALLSSFLCVNIIVAAEGMIKDLIGSLPFKGSFSGLFTVTPSLDSWFVYFIPHILLTGISIIIIHKFCLSEDI